MKLSPVYLRPNYSKTPVNYKNNNINFRANTPQEPSQPQFIMDCSILYQNPMVVLRNKLLQDGFTLKDLKGWYVPNEATPDKIDSKSKQDIETMIRIYDLIKKKYVNEDVLANIEEFDEFAQGMKETFEIETCYGGIDDFKDEIMALLSYLNRHNAPVVEILLDDEDFLNSEINAAIWGMRTPKDVENGLRVYNHAKNKGFYKEFSYPLAVCMSEANEKNLELIKKVIGEENFLTENDDFVLSYLAKFLRMDSAKTAWYLEDDTATLEDVEYWMENLEK